MPIRSLEQQPRKQLRMPEYNYKTPAYYFVTVCTQNRACLFGEILNDEMNLNAAGRMIEQEWLAIPKHYKSWTIDSLIVMPNHIHSIIVLSDAGPARGPAPTLSLPELMRNMKSYTAACYRHGVYNQNWLAFDKVLWQRSYHEHVIRNDNSLDKIRNYISNNPIQWENDEDNPENLIKA